MTLLDRFITAKNVDTRELARLAKISDALLARLRSGRSKPSSDEMDRIAEACSWLTRDTVYTWELFEAIR